MARIAHGTIEIDAMYSEINADMCSGCRMCNALCPYTAIEYDAETNRSFVISALCKACGACVAACPSGAIKARGFTDEQIFAQIEGVLG
jgi:heterodisulfide reductase subunit A